MEEGGGRGAGEVRREDGVAGKLEKTETEESSRRNTMLTEESGSRRKRRADRGKSQTNAQGRCSTLAEACAARFRSHSACPLRSLTVIVEASGTVNSMTKRSARMRCSTMTITHRKV